MPAATCPAPETLLSACDEQPRPRIRTNPRRHRPGHRRRRLLRDARHDDQGVDHRRADPDEPVVSLRVPGRGDDAGAVAALRHGRAANPASALSAAARHPAAGVEHARLPEPALHAARRVHLDRADRSARRHPARGHRAEGRGLAPALGAGGGRLRSAPWSSCARAAPSSAGRSCCRWRSSSPTPGSRSSPAGWRGPKSRSPCTSIPAGSGP